MGEGEKLPQLGQNEAAAVLQTEPWAQTLAPEEFVRWEQHSKLIFNWHTLTMGRNKEGKDLVERSLSLCPEPTLGSVLGPSELCPQAPRGLTT